MKLGKSAKHPSTTIDLTATPRKAVLRAYYSSKRDVQSMLWVRALRCLRERDFLTFKSNIATGTTVLFG
jgi:hypothetical protein